MMEPFVSVVIPTYNRKDSLARLLRSLAQTYYPKKRLEIIVVDNGSTDGTSDMVIAEFPEVQLIRHAQNLMAARARNAGAERATGDYVLFIDDDNVADDPEMIPELVRVMEASEEIGMIGPLMLYYSDPDTIWCAGARYSLLLGLHIHILRNKPRSKARSHSLIPCDYLPNAYMVRRMVLDQVGLEDADAFSTNFEEIDFALRIRKYGFRIVVCSWVSIWHDVPRVQEFRWSELRVRLRGRNRIVFYRKHTPWRALFFPLDIIAFSITMLVSTSKVNLSLVWIYLMGMLDGFRFRF